MPKITMVWITTLATVLSTTTVSADKGSKNKSRSSDASTQWSIDTSHSAASFEIRHMMISSTTGSFADVTGTVALDPKNISNSGVEASINVASINTGDPKRDDHLRSKDFFNAKKFPTMTFKSTKVSSAGQGRYKVTGILTIKGISKTVTLRVEELSKAIRHPMLKVMARGVRATTKINRKDFGLTWNKTMDQGGVVIGEKVKIELDLELHQPLS